MDISAVVVSFNSRNFLADNLDSLQAQSPPFSRIIVVDNHSTDGSREMLANRPGVEAILLDSNIGYAAAANTGIARCDSQLVLVANADIRLETGFSRAVLNHMGRYPDTGLLSPLILRFDGVTVDSAGQECTSALYPRERGYGKPLSRINPRAGKVFSVCGAATVINQRAFAAIVKDHRYYDEDFFMFWEDFDLGWTATEAGICVRFDPDVRVLHFRSATLKAGFRRRIALSLARPSRLRFHLVKNRYLTLAKHFRWRRHWRRIPAVILRDLFWTGLLTITDPRIIIWLLRSGPQLCRARRKRREISDH
ncbi:MAG: glycosyltransferase family 2 protein [Candidatus Aminicenantes bacterium]|nr:glycosyltransferase family 2 protein [Candidatus Aminicenantes bacterium]